MTGLAADYAVCRAINARHGKSFYRATSLLPPARRPHIWALYAVTRRSDDLVDRPEPGRSAAASLAAWRAEVMAALAPDARPRHPVLRALQRTVSSYGIEAGLFEEFFDAMGADLTTRRYATWAHLRGYMRGSAAVIGEMTVPILGGDAGSRPYAARLGEAFQLTNFVRDLAEDWQLGRVYLPMADFRACGVDEDEFGAAVATGRSGPGLRRLVALEVTRARELYDAAAPGLHRVDRSVQPCLRAAFALYGEILNQIERGGFEVCRGRAVVPPARRALVLSRALTGGRPWRSTRSTTPG
ncbi:phytoene/squalene synthase family protein [Flexivirga sp. ID2601S]|uniref:Phytoene/squalene synthase family protein n=1 Tax=Flexivirga aerilata TaxID=1656889 RepID=A0A849AJ35_9MICO|nr:phytoene/squalene synthase family protein [Flexivirga aerilata]NNG39847.1 phytoene/squalene synthase family protein [Flexivirga aerilata]